MIRKWECSNSTCESRLQGRYLTNNEPAYARLSCSECGSPLQTIGGPDAVILVGDKPTNEVLSAGWRPVLREKPSLLKRLSGRPSKCSIDDVDVSTYPELESALEEPRIFHPQLYAYLQTCDLFLSRRGDSPVTAVVVRCASQYVPANAFASLQASIHVEHVVIGGYRVFGVYPLLWRGVQNVYMSEHAIVPYDSLVPADDEGFDTPVYSLTWRKLFYLLTQDATPILFLNESNEVVANLSARAVEAPPSRDAQILTLESAGQTPIVKQDSINLHFQYANMVDIDALRAGLAPA